MTDLNFTVFALGTPNVGELNQIYGAFEALSELTGNQYAEKDMFLLPTDVDMINDLKEQLSYSKFKNYEQYKKTVYLMLDKYFADKKEPPRVFITAYTQARNKQAFKDVDTICRCVKDYYREHNMGKILTSVLTSRLHPYRYVDLINIPKHLLTLSSRIRLLQNTKLKKRSLVTVGTLNNFNQHKIRKQKKELIKKLEKCQQEPALQTLVTKLENFIAAPKKIVICLGGRVEGNEIDFSINFAQKLFHDAQKMSKQGYGVVIINGPRTPNNITDYIYEQCAKEEKIVFQNCKRLAQTEEDRLPKNWRIYSGPHEKEFQQMEKLGNIYPAILGYDNTLVVHTMDSYASCETANAGINTAICSKGIYVDPTIRYDCHNLVKLLCPRYAIDWDNFIELSQSMKIEPKDLRPHILSSPLRVFAETIVSRLSEM